jgi:hypothetical protein
LSFSGRESFPFTCCKFSENKSPDANAHQPQCWMSYGSGHAAYLAVLAFNQFEPDPAIRHALAETDGWITRWDLWLWLKHPSAAW